MSTLTVGQYEALKAKAEKGAKEAERAAGARGQLLKSLKERFDCRTLDEARALLAKKQKQRQVAQKKTERLLTKFREVYGDQLDDHDD